ncbi:restriction endonuclease [Pseudomonas sp. zfem001]|uniref:restriction endonuclease n=1 Tax=Pseudomonas sp. zfem001 TaxID=3078196 RepID=UPI00292A323B|nr:restriction endonuclease [Pseudomonas sp. zfem001]MDU9406348.1 restriction endonuclease [Pseudomonas sp. zfem001]
MKVSESSTDYEKLAKKIYEEILALQGVENIDVRHNVKIKGKSGVEHQIDVFWEYKYAGIVHRVLIECKHYSDAVSLLHVRNLHGLITDIPNSSGIIVTTIGFQAGAKEYANFYGMGLKLIRKPRGEDWDGCIQIINIQMKFNRNHYFDFKVDFDGKDQATIDLARQDPSIMSINSADIIVRDEGHEPCAFNLWLDRHIPSGTDSFGVECEVTLFPEKSYLVTVDGRELKLGRLVVKYISTFFEQDLEIDAMNLVEAVLQDFSSGEVEHMHHKNS